MTIRPSDLPASGAVPGNAAIIVDTGATVAKATPAQVVDAAVPLASQAEAEAGANNAKRMSPLRVAQAIAALGPTVSTLDFSQAGSGAVTRKVDEKLSERLSILDFGADPTGVDLCDDAFADAKAAAQNGEGGGTIYVPQGVYLVSDLPLLDAAGLRIEGDSRFTSRLKVQAGSTGSILYNPNAGAGVSGFHRISNLFFDLDGEDVVAIDLSSVNNSTIDGIRFVGGTGIGDAVGEAVRCAAPLDSGSYTNKIVNCDATYMARAFVAQDAANENTFDNCEAIVSIVGFDVEAGVDTARIISGRAEGCTTGLRTGGREVVVLGCRFEANTAADVEFLAGSERPTFVGCYTATSPTVFLTESNSDGLFSHGGSFPRRNVEPSTSNPPLNSGRTTFAAAGTDPEPSTAATDYALHVQGYVLVDRLGAIEFENQNGGADPDNRLLVMNKDASDRLSIPGFDRKSGTYKRIFVGESVSFLGTEIAMAGIKVIGAQGAAVADATGAGDVVAQLNALLARLRAHGLIAT